MWSARSLVPRGKLSQSAWATQLIVSAPLPRLSLVTPVDRRDTLPLPALLDPLLAVPVSVVVPVAENATSAASPVTSSAPLYTSSSSADLQARMCPESGDGQQGGFGGGYGGGQQYGGGFQGNKSCYVSFQLLSDVDVLS